MCERSELSSFVSSRSLWPFTSERSARERKSECLRWVQHGVLLHYLTPVFICTPWPVARISPTSFAVGTGSPTRTLVRLGLQSESFFWLYANLASSWVALAVEGWVI